jgi:hypothetical protein
MRLTIVPSDNKVVVNGDNSHYPLDLSACNIPTNVHALQWYETEGEVEFDGKPKPQNEDITELPEWALACVAVWEAWTPPVSPSVQDQPTTTGTQTA